MSSQWRCREHDAHVRRCLARRASLKLTQDFAGLLPRPPGATVASAFGPIHICSREGYRVTLGLVKLKRIHPLAAWPYSVAASEGPAWGKSGKMINDPPAPRAGGREDPGAGGQSPVPTGHGPQAAPGSVQELLSLLLLLG
jgi:hypothetical protein